MCLAMVVKGPSGLQAGNCSIWLHRGFWLSITTPAEGIVRDLSFYRAKFDVYKIQIRTWHVVAACQIKSLVYVSSSYFLESYIRYCHCWCLVAALSFITVILVNIYWDAYVGHLYVRERDAFHRSHSALPCFDSNAIQYILDGAALYSHIKCISWSILSVLCFSLRVAYFLCIACDRRESRKKIHKP